MFSFDITYHSTSTLKERIVWMLYLGVMFFLLYGSANQLALLTAPHPSIVFDFEHSLPFVEVFIIPYMSSDLLFVIAFLLPYTRLELRILAVRVFLIILFSVAIFVLFPLQFSFEKPAIESYIFLFTALQTDLPFNQLPSLHVSFAIVLWYSMRDKINSIFIKSTLFVWFGLVILSTLLVYQHHFIDIPTGAIVGLAVIYLIPKESEASLVRSFSTPRSIKMASYYLVGAIVFVILAFSIDMFWMLFLWFFLSLFAVSVAYSFGWKWLIVSSNAQANLIQKIFFLPYFVGNYLSWLYYSQKIVAFTKVEDGIYIGRTLKSHEYTKLTDDGIKHSLNLALEQQFHKPILKQKRFAYLDQTIQDPYILHEAVLYIDKYKNQGVYIHCALGLSRSILLLSAWLLYEGKKLEEIHQQLEIIRPEYIKSPYMNMTLEIYRNFIEMDEVVK